MTSYDCDFLVVEAFRSMGPSTEPKDAAAGFRIKGPGSYSLRYAVRRPTLVRGRYFAAPDTDLSPGPTSRRQWRGVERRRDDFLGPRATKDTTSQADAPPARPRETGCDEDRHLARGWRP